jgi:hypothetical protein
MRAVDSVSSETMATHACVSGSGVCSPNAHSLTASVVEEHRLGGKHFAAPLPLAGISLRSSSKGSHLVINSPTPLPVGTEENDENCRNKLCPSRMELATFREQIRDIAA